MIPGSFHTLMFVTTICIFTKNLDIISDGTINFLELPSAIVFLSTIDIPNFHKHCGLSRALIELSSIRIVGSRPS